VNIANWLVQKSFLVIAAFAAMTFVLGISFSDSTFRFAAWFIAPLHYLRLRQYGAGLLHSLATLVRSKQPLPVAIGVMAERFPIPLVGKKLRQVSQQISAGQPWSDCLRRAGLISSYDAAFLVAAERNGNLPWALEEAATNAERRRVLWLQWRANLVFPVLIVMLGVVTAFVVITLIMPLIALIQGLSGGPRPAR
jgi:type II secretory pathway component PulF